MKKVLSPGEIVARRGYQFGLKQAELEAASGFPLLQLQASSGAIRTLLALKSLPLAEQRVIATALVRWTHRDVLAAMGEPAAGSELLIAENFRAYRDANGVEQLLTAAQPNVKVSRIAGLQSAGWSWNVIQQMLNTPMPKSELRKQIRTRWNDSQHGALKRRGSLEYEAIFAIDRWELVTALDFGGYYQLRVNYRLRQLPVFEMRRGIPFEYWLGQGELGWNCVSREYPEEGIQAVFEFLTQTHGRIREWLASWHLPA